MENERARAIVGNGSCCRALGQTDRNDMSRLRLAAARCYRGSQPPPARCASGSRWRFTSSTKASWWDCHVAHTLSAHVRERSMCSSTESARATSNTVGGSSGAAGGAK